MTPRSVRQPTEVNEGRAPPGSRFADTEKGNDSARQLDMIGGEAQYVSERADYFRPATKLAVNLFQGGGAS